MHIGLDHAAIDLKEDIEKYGIVINSNLGMIGYERQMLTVPKGASRVICRRYIKSYIKEAKKELERLRMTKQPSLFNDMDCAI